MRCIAPEGAEISAPPFDLPGPPRDYLLLGFKSVEESFSQVGTLKSLLSEWSHGRGKD